MVNQHIAELITFHNRNAQKKLSILQINKIGQLTEYKEHCTPMHTSTRIVSIQLVQLMQSINTPPKYKLTQYKNDWVSRLNWKFHFYNTFHSVKLRYIFVSLKRLFFFCGSSAYQQNHCNNLKYNLWIWS